jgi:hypothetical protein
LKIDLGKKPLGMEQLTPKQITQQYVPKKVVDVETIITSKPFDHVVHPFINVDMIVKSKSK